MAILGLGVTGGSQDRTDLGAAQWLVKSSTTHEMTRYLISFPSGAMDHIPREELPARGKPPPPAPQGARAPGGAGLAAGRARAPPRATGAGGGSAPHGT